jgi:hypothetical protein
VGRRDTLGGHRGRRRRQVEAVVSELFAN